MCPPTDAPTYQDLLKGSSAAWAKERAQKLAEDGFRPSRDLYEANRRRQEEHDTLLDICVSAFGPESRMFADHDFAFITSEPLKERGLKSFDCLVYSAKKGYALFIECKSSIASQSVVLNDTRETIADAVANREYLEGKIGGKIAIAEYVLCVPSPELQDLYHAIRRVETVAGAVRPEPPILLWSVDKFSGQKLQLCTTMTWRQAPDGQHRDPGLTRLLGAGVNVGDSEVVAKVYPSSHPSRIGKELIVQAWRPVGPQKSGTLNISVTRATTGLAEPATMPHYAAAELAPDLVARFAREAVEYGILEEGASKGEMLPLRVEGKQLQTILKGYEKAHRDGWAERYSRRRAEAAVVAEFYRRQKRLTDDSNDAPEGEPGPAVPR